MSSITITPPIRSSAATALRRILLGPELSAAELAAARRVLEHLPARLRRPESGRWWQASRVGCVTRRTGVVVCALVLFAVLSVVAAPSAQAFDIFGPVKHAFEDAMNWFIDQIAHAICDFVAGFVHGILDYADKGLGINFNANWFKHNYENMMTGGFLMGLAIMLVQCTAAALRRNPAQMLTAVSATLVGVLTSFIALTLIMMVSGAIDDWCAAVTGGHNIADSTRDTIKGLVDKIGGIGAILVAVLYLVFSLLLFIVLIVRRLGIYIISLFIPIYAGGLGGTWTSPMIKRASELLLVLLLTKLAIIGTFTLGASMLIGDTKGLGAEVNAVSGVVVMGFAILSPLGVMYLVAFADGLLTGQLHSASHAGRGGLSQARNQLRGHDGRGNRSALGRVTGAGSKQVRPAHAGGSTVISSARRAAHRVRPGGRPGSRPGGRGTNDSARQSRARGARRAAGRGAVGESHPTDSGGSTPSRRVGRSAREGSRQGGNAGDAS